MTIWLLWRSSMVAGHGGSWRCRSSWSGRGVDVVLLARSSTVEVAASPPAVRRWPGPALQLHQALGRGAVRAEVGFDVSGHLTDGGEIDAEQFRTAPAAPRSAGPDPGRAKPPIGTGYRTQVRTGIGNAA